MPTQGNSNNVKVIPKLDGLKKCRFPNSVDIRKTCLEAIAAAAANATGIRRSFEYSSIEQAKPEMWAGRKKSTNCCLPPAKNRGRRRCIQFGNGLRLFRHALVELIDLSMRISFCLRVSSFVDNSLSHQPFCSASSLASSFHICRLVITVSSSATATSFALNCCRETKSEAICSLVAVRSLKYFWSSSREVVVSATSPSAVDL